MINKLDSEYDIQFNKLNDLLNKQDQKNDEFEKLIDKLNSKFDALLNKTTSNESYVTLDILILFFIEFHINYFFT